MIIDWFTVGAQLLNFLILVWLLKRFLYAPIREAIDAREARIAAHISEAEAKAAEAQQEHDLFQNKNTEFEEKRSEMLADVRQQAQLEHQKLVEAARKAADEITTKHKESLENDAQSLEQAIREQMQSEVFATARHVLMELANQSLEDMIVDVFLQRVQSLDKPAQQALIHALPNSAHEPALVRSAFDLNEEQRKSIHQALTKAFSTRVFLQFETAPQVVSGLEFSTQGYKVAWSISEYLSSMEAEVQSLLTTQAVPASMASKPLLIENKPETKSHETHP
jgi:F-type H+-transporting ATPase subunit b